MPLTPLVGRQREITALCELLTDAHVRLVTLTGTAGVGKTRLGVQVATEIAGQFADGVCLVDLAPISRAETLAPTIVQALGLLETSRLSSLDHLMMFLRGKHLLLFLDNVEQLLVATCPEDDPPWTSETGLLAPAGDGVAAATQIAVLLSACPRLTCLVTSRMPLHISGEHEFPVPPLAQPDLDQAEDTTRLAQVASVDLFLQRAQAVRPDFRLSAANAPTMVRVSSRLEGVPLAIELAAPLIKVLPLRAISGSLDKPLRLLSSGPSDVPERQRSLANAIAWSYNLLTAEEQRLLQLLSVFRGGCTLEAAAALWAATQPAAGALTSAAADVLRGITALVDKSLLRQVAPDDAEPRYAMLESIREYALDRLEESGAGQTAREAHTAFYLALADQAMAGRKTAEQAAWVERLGTERDNLRAALRWALDNRRLETALRLCGGQQSLWSVHSACSEGRAWAEETLAQAEPELGWLDGEDVDEASIEARRPLVTAWIWVLIAAGGMAWVQGDFPSGSCWLQKSLRLSRRLHDRALVRAAIWYVVETEREAGDLAAARRLNEEALAIARELGDPWALANALDSLGATTRCEGDLVEARRLYEESIAMFRTLGTTATLAWQLMELSGIACDQGDYAAAQKTGSESQALLDSVGDRRGAAFARMRLSQVALAQGDTAAALRLSGEGLDDILDLGQWPCLRRVVLSIARATAHQYPERTVRLFAACEPLFQAASGPLRPGATSQPYRVEDRSNQHYLAEARARLTAAEYAAAWSAGQAMSWPEAIQYARDTVDFVLAAGASGLTRRELEVLGLVAGGMTNAQIAEQLVISPRTVNAHLTAIYSKLDVTTRTAAARCAIDRCLI